MHKRTAYLSLVLLTFIVVWAWEAFAQDKNSSAPIFIRDQEIEDTLRLYATPLFKGSGLEADHVRIYIIQDPSLNAFVSGGMNLFVHTGLISFSDDPLVLIGVIAHETGHIAGGHLIRKIDEYEKATLGSALSYVLGAGAAVAGLPQAGAAIISGGQHLAARNFLQHSRAHEQAADQHALDLLDKTHYSAKGLLALLQYLGTQETLFYNTVNPYALTHPLSQERVSHITNHITQSPSGGADVNPTLQHMQQRIVAKLKGFLDAPDKSLASYPPQDTSVAARYARTIAYHRRSELEPALKELDSLLADYPDDAYFHELRGQLLYEHGRITDAIPSYQRALDLKPGAPLLLLELAMAQIASDQPALVSLAINHLEKTLVLEPESSLAWNQLGIAYGKKNQLGLSYLALAEEATLKNNKDEALRFTKLAEQYLDTADPATQRLQDIRGQLKRQKDKK